MFLNRSKNKGVITALRGKGVRGVITALGVRGVKGVKADSLSYHFRIHLQEYRL